MNVGGIAVRVGVGLLWSVLLAGRLFAADPATMPAVGDPKGLQLKAAEMGWWQDAKFGMFIHWGLYSIPAVGEWHMYNDKVPAEEYRKLMGEFDPKKYDPGEWARTAKDAGMRYMVLTARHHDGFALWDSASSYQQYDAMHAAARRDLVAPYVKAARDAGLRVGLYYSPMDWRFPGYFDPKGQAENAALMKKQAWGQVEELTTKYGQIDILWYDGGWLAMKGSDADAEPFWESNKLAAMVRGYQPKVIISPRSGWVGDFAVDEGGGAVTGPIKASPWEKCLNLNQTAWGYTTRQNLMSRNQVVTMLVNTVVRGGNMLLNVGPDRDGVIPETHVARLKEVGEWLRKYGESIYGTRAGPLEPVENRGRGGAGAGTVFGTTYRDKTIYVHVLTWRQLPVAGTAARGTGGAGTNPAEPETLVLGAVKAKIVGVKVLTGGSAKFTQTSEGVTVTLPRENHDAVDTIFALECEGAVGG